MPFLGNTPANTFVSIAKQTITGNGGTSYSLSYAVTSANDIDVFYNNVRQEPGVAYTANGTTITFTEAIQSTDSVYILFNGQAVGTIDAPAGVYLPTTGGTVNGEVIVNNKIQIQQDASSNNRLILRGKPTSSYRWNIDNFDTGNTLRFFRENDSDSSSGVVHLSLDSNGRLLNPNQPMFAGRLSSGTVPASSARITTITADINVGNHWSSGVFTCPIGGRYFVSSTVMKDQGAGQVVHVDIYKNGAWYNSSYRNRASDGDNYTQSSLSTIIECSANDTLEYRWFGGCNCLTTHDAFVIYLLG